MSSSAAPAARSDIRLRPLRDEDEAAVRAANTELAPDGFDFALGLDPDVTWSAYRQAKIDAHLGRIFPTVGFRRAS